MSIKDFDKAVIAYTGGIKANSPDPKVVAVLYTNRAIANGMMSKEHLFVD